MAPAQVALVFSYQYPGKYAFNVLAGAVESAPGLSAIELHFPRDRQALLAEVQACLARGKRVVAAWSFYSPSFPAAADEAAWLKAELGSDQVLCIAGGVHATAEPEQTLRAGFELVAVGEGERILLELLERLQAGDDPRATRGMARLENGKVVHNGRGERIDLDAYPPFAPRRRRFGAIEITRGCIYACRFCQTPYMNKARFRHRSAEDVSRWVRVLRAAGKRDIRFISPTSLSYGSQDESVNLAAVEELLARVREAAGPEGRVPSARSPPRCAPSTSPRRRWRCCDAAWTTTT